MKKLVRICFCSIWQLVKNWLDRNDWNHILRHYSPCIWTIPFDKTAKRWKSMILDIIIKTRSGGKCRMSLDETLKNNIQDQFIVYEMS